jgi:hypothetical protein
MIECAIREGYSLDAREGHPLETAQLILGFTDQG